MKIQELNLKELGHLYSALSIYLNVVDRQDTSSKEREEHFDNLDSIRFKVKQAIDSGVYNG